MNGYLCYFMFPELDQDVVGMEMHTVQDNPFEPGLERLGAFTAGFWLTEAMELCTGADEDKKYWIPPAAIYMIEVFQRLDPEDPGGPDEDDDTPEII